MPVLMTERLMLRRMKPCDAADMFEYAGDPEVPKYLTWSVHPNEDFTRDYLEFLETKYREGDFFDWALIWRGDGMVRQKMIGTCGFASFDFRNNSAEIGYVINPAFRGRGIAAEAAVRVMRYGFGELELNRIEARYIIGNDASRRVMDKIGMRFEGVKRAGILQGDRYRDVGFCAILADDFRRLHPGPASLR